MTLKSINEGLTQKAVFLLWLPLAFMWIIMSIELPVVNAFVARLPRAADNLAAFGITFSLCLIIESPIIQFLTAATALVKGPLSYRKMIKFMHIFAVGLTAIHLLIGLTPLYAYILRNIMKAPEQIIPLSRTAFIILTPWSAAIGYRRLWQGILIGYKKANVIPVTMILRIAAAFIVVIMGYRIPGIPGASLAAWSLTLGVISGAIASYLYIIPLKNKQFFFPDFQDQDLSWKELLGFYIPLALTSFINLAARAVISLGIARAAFPLESLAVWPVLLGFIFLFQSLTMCYQEAVIALLTGREEYKQLKKFMQKLAFWVGAAILLVAVTPAGRFYFKDLTGLTEDLLAFTRLPLFIIIPIPIAITFTSWYRGILVKQGNTLSVTKGVIINSLVLLVFLFVGIGVLPWGGVVIASAAYTLSFIIEALYLWKVTRY